MMAELFRRLERALLLEDVLELVPDLVHLRQRHRAHVALRRVVAHVVLVVGLGGVEPVGRQRLQRRDDRPVERLGVGQIGDERRRDLLLLLVLVEDRAAVLRADVGALRLSVVGSCVAKCTLSSCSKVIFDGS